MISRFLTGFLKGFIIALVLLLALKTFAQEQIRLGTANTVTLRGEISSESAQRTAVELIHLDAIRGHKDYPIYLVLDTPGGSIEAGEMLIEVAKSIKNLNTITIFAASMGSAIVEALPGDRLIISSGILMFHRAAGQIQGQFEDGEMESRLEFYKKYVRRMEIRNADRMKIPLTTYKKKIKDELWLTSNESLSTFAADRPVELLCSPALLNKTEQVTIEVFIFKLNLEFSGCPLLRGGTVQQGQPEEAVAMYNKYKNMPGVVK